MKLLIHHAIRTHTEKSASNLINYLAFFFFLLILTLSWIRSGWGASCIVARKDIKCVSEANHQHNFPEMHVFSKWGHAKWKSFSQSDCVSASHWNLAFFINLENSWHWRNRAICVKLQKYIRGKQTKLTRLDRHWIRSCSLALVFSIFPSSAPLQWRGSPSAQNTASQQCVVCFLRSWWKSVLASRPRQNTQRMHGGDH